MYMYFRKHFNFAIEFVILSLFWIDVEVVSWLAIKTWLTFVSKFWVEYCWNSSDRCYFSTQWQFQESKYLLPTLSFLHSILLPLSFSLTLLFTYIYSFIRILSCFLKVSWRQSDLFIFTVKNSAKLAPNHDEIQIMEGYEIHDNVP